MGKITKYLNEHFDGFVVNSSEANREYSVDSSPLTITPEFIALPRVTNDVRKAVRFSWQLAEKGHRLGITARGFGKDTTGGSIGEGLVIDMSRYLTSILYLPGREKKKFIHAEAGISLRTLHEVLRWHGLTLGAYTPDMQDMTLGGAIASGVATYRSGKYGRVSDAVERLEVVLSNGDLMEVGHVSKKEVNKKQGEQTLEGEIYRRLDGLLEDEEKLIDKLSSDHDQLGYAINKIRKKDGSYNLVPLFAGSQGTLGLISEVVMKADYYSSDESAAIILVPDAEVAQDIADQVHKMTPASVVLFSQKYLEEAADRGKKFVFTESVKSAKTPMALYVSFDDFGEKVRSRKLKKLQKQALEQKADAFYSTLDHPLHDITALRDAWQLIESTENAKLSSVPVTDGAYIPPERLRSFLEQFHALGKKQHIELPYSVDMMTGVVSSSAMINTNTVSGKQQVVKLLNTYAALVSEHGGTLAGTQAEGRLVSFAAYKQIDDDVRQLNEKIKQIFDPYSILNPGVKQQVDAKSIAESLRQSK